MNPFCVFYHPVLVCLGLFRDDPEHVFVFTIDERFSHGYILVLWFEFRIGVMIAVLKVHSLTFGLTSLLGSDSVQFIKFSSLYPCIDFDMWVNRETTDWPR
jgi:hypothetical protein